jgi:predicted esterase
MRLNFLLLLFILISSCKSDSGQQETTTANQTTEITQPTKPVFNAGDLLERINCTGDPSLTFALYLPTSYSDKVKIPLILFFDPQGDGVLPLNKYRKLADQYGYALMASNDSRNGNNAQQTAHILEELVQSSLTILNTDSSRIYAAGFSGGARVAAMLGLSPSGIQGLAISGAGFPSEQWSSIPPSVIVAMAGNSDMNLSEFMTLQPREEFKGRYQFIRYNGKHEWPPVEIFENAFMAFESFAMRDKLKAADQKVFQYIDSRFRQQAAQLNVGGRLIESKLLYEAWIKDLEGQFEIADVIKAYNGIVSRPQYQMNTKNETIILEEEIKLRAFYAESIGTKDTVWWYDNMQKLQTEIKVSKDRQRSEMLQRVQGYVSLGLYSALSRVMRTNMQDTKSSGYLSTLYRITDPENAEAWYLSAIIASVEGKSGQAIMYLQKSVDAGFSDLKRLQTETAFQPLNASTDFEKIVSRVRQQQKPG